MTNKISGNRGSKAKCGSSEAKPKQPMSQAELTAFINETLRQNLEDDLAAARKQREVEAAAEKAKPEDDPASWKSLSKMMHAANEEMKGIG